MSWRKCRLRHLRPCDGPGELHHIVPKQRIKHRVSLAQLPYAIKDRRNLVPLCRRHHHRITHGFDREAMAEQIVERLPGLHAFAGEYGLDAALAHELRLYEIDREEVPPAEPVT